jgi:3-phenylpropionate/cinnamic acid dioxygenase small subunit
MSEEIRGLLARYCELIDEGDFDGVGELFADGRLVDSSGRELAKGANAVADFYRSSEILYEGSPRTKHLVLNTTLESDGGAVVARSSYLVLQALEDFPLQPIITGRYVDRFERDADERWYFTERRFIVDLVGDLSRHLRYEI